MEIGGVSSYDEWMLMQKKREELMAASRPKTAKDAKIVSIEDQDGEDVKRVFMQRGMDVVEISMDCQEYRHEKLED